MLQMNGIAHMPGLAFDVRGAADAQIDSSNLPSSLGVNHPKMVSRRFVNFMRRKPNELQP